MKQLLLFLPLVLSGATSSADKAPNFIIIYADDLGYADTSVQMMDDDSSTKHDFIQTPGLDRLADLGARYTVAYAPTPTCTGSRMSIQHGQSSARMQYRNVFDVLSPIQRPNGYADEITIAEMLKAAGRGYITAMFGKGNGPMGRADESGYDVTDENPDEPGGNGNGHGSYWDPISKKTTFPPDNPKRLYSLRDDSVAFINEYAGKQPFYMMVSHYAPHIPFMCTDEAFERNKARWIAEGRDTKDIESPKSSVNKAITYAAMIEEMDLTVGNIIDALVAKGELDSTYIFFSSDNGGGFARWHDVNGKRVRYNGPLQGGKRSMFEGGLRVPTLISGPGIEPGSECHVPIVQWDLLATFHDLSGSQAPLPENNDGGSLRDVFEKGNTGTGERAAPGIIHHYTCHYHPPISSIVIGDYKLMKHLVSGEYKLFNIQKDYGEENNLAAQMPEKVASMDAIREQYIKDVDGGQITEVYQALYDLMDEFSRRAHETYQRDLAVLQAKSPTDFDAQKAVLLKSLNETLKRNAMNKIKTELFEESGLWKEASLGNQARKIIDETWVDVVPDQSY